jgi:hypothetical protein
MVAVAGVETLAGIRPLAQLARWVTPEVYDALGRRAALTERGRRAREPAGDRPRLGSGRAGSDGGHTGSSRGGPGDAVVHRPSVRRVRACVVSEHAVEASVVVAHADRVRAVAVRLTRSAGRWRASALVIG